MIVEGMCHLTKQHLGITQEVLYNLIVEDSFIVHCYFLLISSLTFELTDIIPDFMALAVCWGKAWRFIM